MKSIVVLWNSVPRSHLWVEDHYEADTASFGASDADRSALATALAVASPETIITVLSLGPSRCEAMLREALANGAHRALLLHTSDGDHDPRSLARTIAAHCPPADLILAGDIGATGLIPSLVAAHLSIPVVVATLELAVAEGTARAHRRLEGGRRQDLSVSLPAVIAVESGRELPRASLPMLLEAQDREIERIAIGELPSAGTTHIPWVGPAAWISPPEGSAELRIEQLTGNAGGAARGRSEVVCEPDEAAERILDQLRSWGYLAEPSEAASE